MAAPEGVRDRPAPDPECPRKVGAAGLLVAFSLGDRLSHPFEQRCEGDSPCFRQESAKNRRLVEPPFPFPRRVQGNRNQDFGTLIPGKALRRRPDRGSHRFEKLSGPAVFYDLDRCGKNLGKPSEGADRKVDPLESNWLEGMDIGFQASRATSAKREPKTGPRAAYTAGKGKNRFEQIFGGFHQKPAELFQQFAEGSEVTPRGRRRSPGVVCRLPACSGSRNRRTPPRKGPWPG